MKWLKSRTVWTIAFTALLGAIQATSDFFDPTLYTLINTVLLAVAAYFRIDARVK